MSEQDNVQIVQAAYAAFGSGNIPALVDLVADDIDWHAVQGASSSVPSAGPRKGRAAVSSFFQQVGESIDFETFEPKEFLPKGDKVVVLGTYKGRAKKNGKAFGSDWVMIFTFRDGKIAEFREYFDPTTMNQAFA